MRAITGAVVSFEPCTLKEAHDLLSAFCSSPDSYLTSSDCATYVLALDDAIREHHKFLRHCSRAKQQQGTADHEAHGYEVLVEGERERQGGEKNGDKELSLGGPHGSVEEVEVTVAAGEKKSKERNREEEAHDDRADAGVPSHAPASPEIVFEQRKKKKKEKHSNNESVVKQEPDLIVEEDGKKKRKKKEKHSDKELARAGKQEPGLVVEEELVSEKKKVKKKREKDHVKLEEDVVEVKGQKVNDGVVEQGVAHGEKKRKKKKRSEEEGDSKGVEEEEDNMAIDSDLNSAKKKKKKKRGRGDDDDDDVQE